MASDVIPLHVLQDIIQLTTTECTPVLNAGLTSAGSAVGGEARVIAGSSDSGIGGEAKVSGGVSE